MNKLKNILIFFILSLFIPFTIPLLKQESIIAHTVEVSEDVAATFHLEPNHNPRAGEKSTVWFALTKKGGEIIPLAQCNCLLAVYAQPRQPNSSPLMQPSLNPISVENYQDIPSAEIIFPQPGAYELELKGTGINGANFQPFSFTYTVIVRN